MTKPTYPHDTSWTLERSHADRYVQPRRCVFCDSTRVFGEAGWRLCTNCGWDELAHNKDAA